MRHLTSHIVNPVNDKIVINVLDEPGAGGANHSYQVVIGETGRKIAIDFQNGPISEKGVNGLTQEALLAIVIDRLECFQAGPFACQENGEALICVKEALECLKSRTRERMARGVEGRTVK